MDKKPIPVTRKEIEAFEKKYGLPNISEIALKSGKWVLVEA